MRIPGALAEGSNLNIGDTIIARKNTRKSVTLDRRQIISWRVSDVNYDAGIVLDRSFVTESQIPRLIWYGSQVACRLMS